MAAKKPAPKKQAKPESPSYGPLQMTAEEINTFLSEDSKIDVDLPEDELAAKVAEAAECVLEENDSLSDCAIAVFESLELSERGKEVIASIAAKMASPTKSKPVKEPKAPKEKKTREPKVPKLKFGKGITKVGNFCATALVLRALDGEKVTKEQAAEQFAALYAEEFPEKDALSADALAKNADVVFGAVAESSGINVEDNTLVWVG